MEPTFNDIMKVIGNNGKYQKRFNIIFNFILVFFSTLIYMNIIYSLIIPDHWCFVPGRESTNMTEVEWRNYTIPRDESGKYVYEKCKMYNNSQTINSVILPDKLDVIDCQFGWEYDKTWYKKTAPSQENWVCDKELNVANALAVAKIGEVIGTLIFGQLGDRFGRKKIFFVTIVIITIGQSSLTFTSHSLTWFLFFMFIGNSTTTQLLISPLIISMEISRNEDRTYIAMLQRISWTIALCIMPLIMWILGDWVPFMLITTLPCAIFLFSNRFIIESPRWLANKGKIKQCMGELKKIAKVNQTNLPNDLENSLRRIGAMNEKFYGIMSLFSSWRLAKNGLVLITGWVMGTITYMILTLNVSNLGGNPFLNFFWQGFAELPASILAKYSCDNLGRRWTNVISFVVLSFGSVPIIFLVADSSHEILSVTLTVLLKFAVASALYTIQLQGLEIFPTCVRQTGQSLGWLSSNAAAILAPYIIYLGTSIDKSYPYIICGLLGIIGVISGFFLPETLTDARNFGADQSYLSTNCRKIYVQAESHDLDDKCNVGIS